MQPYYLAIEEVGDRMVYLYKNGNHFDVITSMPGFLCKDYYCHTCKKAFAHARSDISVLQVSV